MEDEIRVITETEDTCVVEPCQGLPQQLKTRRRRNLPRSCRKASSGL